MVKKKIAVVGSLNADLVLTASRLPLPGETLACGDLMTVPGGKGANQACAAGRLGGAAAMFGQVGDDAFGPVLVASLRSAGVDVSGVRTVDGATGTAVILVMPGGENSILISPGANGSLALDGTPLAGAGDCLLGQLEVPLETTVTALRAARAEGAVTILDPAPAQALSHEVLSLVDWLTPNQTEAAILLGRPELVIESYEDAAAAARELLATGPSGVIVKLGRLGCVIADAGGVQKCTSYPVTAVDTTAAGDVFNGAFAVGLIEGKTPLEAARFACAVAAISVTRMGAQPSMPSRAEVEKFILEVAPCS